MNKDTIVLIGMPGCGKSTLGKIAANILNCDFVDLDSAIEADCGKSIPDIFKENGEGFFRRLETAQLEKQLKAAPKDSQGASPFKIIASGGGIITQEQNLRLLKKAYVIFIDRPLDTISADIDSSNRPLLSSSEKSEQASRLKQLYLTRYPIYKSVCDACLENTGSTEDAACRLTEIITNVCYID